MGSRERDFFSFNHSFKQIPLFPSKRNRMGLSLLSRNLSSHSISSLAFFLPTFTLYTCILEE
ncbi:MAG: hypothetical protein D6785_10405 [Planctomycetota bacterium]|nr:MAG: hypothetical protein D6785_10405 [Planctomycetota bacterium]